MTWTIALLAVIIALQIYMIYLIDHVGRAVNHAFSILRSEWPNWPK